MTHTPGPWKADMCGVSAGEQDICDCGERAQWSGDSFHPFPNAEANARLIASAPDLLEAVQNLMGLFDTPVVRRRLKDDALYPEVINQARAAIARAKGE